MQWDTIYKQDKYLQRGVDGKSIAGGEHIKKAFLEYASGIQQPVAVPVHIPQGVTPNYALCMVYFAGTQPYNEIATTADMFRIDSISKWISGWSDLLVIIAGIAGRGRRDCRGCTGNRELGTRGGRSQKPADEGGQRDQQNGRCRLTAGFEGDC